MPEKRVGEATEFMRGLLVPAVEWLRLAIEMVGGLWIAIGFVYALTQLILAHLRGRTTSFTPIRLTFSRYLSLALEFQLASDILSTSIAPSWSELGKLGATAVIRTALNYFLSREIREYSEKEQSMKEAAVIERLRSPAASEDVDSERTLTHIGSTTVFAVWLAMVSVRAADGTDQEETPSPPSPSPS